MNLLTISDEDGTVVVQVKIRDVEPDLATVAILNALKELPAIPKPSKPRSDKGKTKATT